MFSSLTDLFNKAEESGIDVADIVINQQAEIFDLKREQILQQMEDSLLTMEQSIEEGLSPSIQTLSGLVGPDAHRLYEHSKNNMLISGPFMGKVMAYAYAVATVNAAMGKIVAAPTGGSSGILPAVIIAAGEELNVSREKLRKALVVAAAIGLVISDKATLSGAAGGCQAECGAGAAMAAGALVYLRGGTHTQIQSAVAIALKNMLGLVCDPVAGLVEIPCIKRNATSAAHAVIAADIASADIQSIIPADEVIIAMADVGERMPSELKETAKGGLAITPTGLRINEEIHK